MGKMIDNERNKWAASNGRMAAVTPQTILCGKSPFVSRRNLSGSPAFAKSLGRTLVQDRKLSIQTTK